MSETTLKGEGEIIVRSLRTEDLEAIVVIDAARGGGPRREYLRLKLDGALRESSVRISLAAEVEGRLVGFLLGAVYYGDYGLLEPVATIDVIGVSPGHGRRGVGRALWQQLAVNLKGMRIDRVQTQVEWASWDLMTYFQRLGFKPATRVCLERQLDFLHDE